MAFLAHAPSPLGSHSVFQESCISASTWSVILIACAQLAIAQSTFRYEHANDFTTEAAYQAYVNGGTCSPPTCSYLPDPGGGVGSVNSSDEWVSQSIYISNLVAGEAVSWKFATPDGVENTIVSLTYDAASKCFISSPGFKQICGSSAISVIVAGNVNSCHQQYSKREIGQWSLNSYDGNTPLYSNVFQVSRNPNSAIGITYPPENQLLQLSQGNYNSTGELTFTGGTSTEQPIEWTVALHYQSSSGYPTPATDPATLMFEGTSHTFSGYQGIGGQVQGDCSNHLN